MATRRSRTRAPELSGSGGWLNTDVPLSLASLRGKVVLLDFWTYCCINCLRLLEELRPLERRWREELVVVGVHSPKFPRESDHAALAAAVARHRITHPVLDDPELATWDQYAVKGWPTVVLVDPEGYVVGAASGEGCGPVLDQAIADTVARAEATGTLVRGGGLRAPGSPPAGVLAFPGKVAVDAATGRIAIADTGHDRVLVTDAGGLAVAEVTGLRQPQGVRFAGAGLVVCDTGADRVVEVSLSERGAGPVVTVADGLASPWDVAVEPAGSLLVAEAGRHRLWRIPAGSGPRPAQVAAGSGREGLADGPAAEAELAQPSGVCVAAGGAAFVDAEASALRVLAADGRVGTLVGGGLFEWGDEDGPPAKARLQHPLGVAAAPDGRLLYVADTFNSRVRAWDGAELSTVDAPGLAEPGGLDVAPDGLILVADTNNNRVVAVSGGRVEPLAVDTSWLGAEPGPALLARRGATFTVDVTVGLGGRLLDHSGGPPVRATVDGRPGSLLAPGPRQWALDDVSRLVQLTAGPGPGSGVLLVEITAAVCGDGTCEVVTRRRRHPITVT